MISISQLVIMWLFEISHSEAAPKIPFRAKREIIRAQYTLVPMFVQNAKMWRSHLWSIGIRRKLKNTVVSSWSCGADAKSYKSEAAKSAILKIIEKQK